MEWEDRLMEEMNRLKNELEQVHIEDRNVALAEAKSEYLMDIQNIATKYKQKEDALAEEVCGVRASLYTTSECALSLLFVARNVTKAIGSEARGVEAVSVKGRHAVARAPSVYREKRAGSSEGIGQTAARFRPAAATTYRFNW